MKKFFVFVAILALAVSTLACGFTAQGNGWQVQVGDPTQVPVVSTQVVPTVQNVENPPTAQAVAPVEQFTLYESEGGIPFSGSVWNADVAPDEIEVLTGGPMAIGGVSLPGGENRGSVIILLPGTKVVPYEVKNLLAGANWHASYRPTKVDEATWRALVNDRVMAMQQAPNCSLGVGCKTIDVLIVGPDGVVDRWTVQ